jgi:hypothetical protein
MLFKLSELFGITRSLPKLTDKELPIKISYRLLKFMKRASEEMDVLEKARVKLVEKYSDKKNKNKEDEKEVKVADENKNEFQEEFAKLLEEEIEIDFDIISISELGDISFAAKDLMFLDKIIKD